VCPGLLDWTDDELSGAAACKVVDAASSPETADGTCASGARASGARASGARASRDASGVGDAEIARSRAARKYSCLATLLLPRASHSQ